MSALATTRPLRVVIIDDTPDLRELLRIALTRGGFEVVGEAGDGSKGIDVVRLHRPDVVLLDLAMPVMDGIEALPSIRRLCPAAKIIVLSGFGAQQMSARAVAAGADGYVQKGAPLNTILDYVRDMSTGGRRPSRGLAVVPVHQTPAAAPHSDKLEDERKSGTAAVDAPTRSAASATAPANVSAWEAMRMAPYGVIELADEPLFRIVHANPMGARLLGTDKSGTPLAMVAPELAALVSYHRLDNDATFETQVDGGRVRVTLRRTGWSVMVFLDSTAEDVGLLRRAIATTAHEVRGPVAVLCGIAETLAWDADSMSLDQTRRLMESVARQARILDRITADLLTAAQIQRGTLRIDQQVVEPRTLILGTIEGRWDVEVAIEDDRPVRADPLRLEQMLTNLLSNAHKYGAAPYIVRVRPDGDFVAIDVIDHGEGVPAEFVNDLFHEFARAHGAVATGTGLGLYVVRTLAQAQNGTVTYAPGTDGGSVFTVRLLAC
ncbi:response regulator [Nocardioides sp.]|uniref:ATP-binding response regulator n=1 Tax=Nocardioides sp. TaxID=35761 RepID=UPI00271B5ABB|nr:response regulator [Nocardioides sp.]MDO9458025.1 response regulator [Nocardioides sp.]